MLRNAGCSVGFRGISPDALSTKTGNEPLSIAFMARGSSVPAGVPGGSTPKALRDQALADLDALIEVAADARRALRSYQSELEKNRRQLERGDLACEMAARVEFRTVRSTLTDCLDHIERARNASRRSFWRLQLSEGATIADIARSWGFSRQLVSRALAGGAALGRRGGQ